MTGITWAAAGYCGSRQGTAFVNRKDAAVIVEVRRPATEPGRSSTVVVRSNLRVRRERGELVWRFRLPAGRERVLQYELKAERLLD